MLATVADLSIQAGPPARSSAVQGLGPVQSGVAAVVILCGLFALETSPGQAWEALHAVMRLTFGAVAIWRLMSLALVRSQPQATPLPDIALPTYTVIAPLFREAAMVTPLLEALEQIDYPREQLQIILALELNDTETRAAVDLAAPLHGVEVIVLPPGAPQTKPRACNAALALARGELIVVYDAEDRPDPKQLREAAARFAATERTLACLQAPLRIRGGGGFIARQFELEYAALFEVTLPALARLGAPFPLGGTSNHFRSEALRAVGGWDAWNVTEDADVGFRLAAAGYRLGMISSPTLEDAPDTLSEWIPQRARWLKGYMQTWAVHMRSPWKGGLGRFMTLQATIGLSILSALAHGPTLALLAWALVVGAIAPERADAGLPDLILFGGGWGAAALSISAGARRAGRQARVIDALLAPAYWPLQSAAFWKAAFQLVTRPHHWDKTPHRPWAVDGAEEIESGGASEATARSKG